MRALANRAHIYASGSHLCAHRKWRLHSKSIALLVAPKHIPSDKWVNTFCPAPVPNVWFRLGMGNLMELIFLTHHRVWIHINQFVISSSNSSKIDYSDGNSKKISIFRRFLCILCLVEETNHLLHFNNFYAINKKSWRNDVFMSYSDVIY
jgi:hypothetical protein